LALILYPADGAVLPDPVSPESYLFSCQRFAKVSWVVVSGNALLEESDYS